MRFFKYVSAATAEKILTTAHLRWSSPSLFNDPFDVQFDLHVEEFDETRMAALIIEELWSIYSGRKTLNPANELGRIFALFLSKRAGLSRADVFDTKGLYDAIIESFGRMKALVPGLQEHQRLLLKDVKLLCLSEVHDNILMWSHYAREHSGAVLEFASSPQGKTVFNMAERVIYSAAMPRLMTQEDIIRSFSGQSRMDAKALMHNSIFVKAMNWCYEKEWRIWLPGKETDRHFVDLPFDRTDLVGVYTGCRIEAKDQETLASVAKEHFAHASLFSAHKSAREFGLRFERIG